MERTEPRSPKSDAEGRAHLRTLLDALDAANRGEFDVRLSDKCGDAQFRAVATAFNDLVTKNQRLSEEMIRVERVVGREGRMTERAQIGDGVAGGWAMSVDSINALIGDLVQPTAEVARLISAVAEGDLTQKMALEIDGQQVKGEFLRIGTTVNSMVDQLSSFAGEVTRVAKEVGTEGKLGGQAEVRGASGTWKDLTDNVNSMASNLTGQVRNIAVVTTAVANGDLSTKITVEARGEILELKNTINTMVDQLNSFASEVTRVAREVGTEGNLPHVFDRFRQADNTITRTHQGLGLGLSIVRHLVMLHGGSVSVESEGLGKGSTFRVVFPSLDPQGDDPVLPTLDGLREAQGPRGIPTANPPRRGSDPQSLEGVRVLFVEDDPDARELFSSAFRRLGADVTATDSVPEALEALSASPFDVLVSDIGLRGEDGFSFLRKVRAADNSGAQVPAIAVSGFARSEAQKRALEAGFQAYLTKPVEPAELIDVVANFAHVRVVSPT